MAAKIQPFLNDLDTIAIRRESSGERNPPDAALKNVHRRKGFGMKFKVLAAVALIAFATGLLPVTGSSPASAQIERAAPSGEGPPPIAAPTGGPASSSPIAAPAGTAQTAGGGLSAQQETAQTFTPFGLFMRADIVVKCVLLLLLFASFWSWVLIIDKGIAFFTLKRKAREFERNFWSGRSLEDLYAQHSHHADQPFTAVFVAALREWKRSFESGAPREALVTGVKERVEKAMNVSIQRELEKIERGLGYLATVGSTAPFVGLFGTVWGIMTSFQAIAARQDTTLAVVAPGIAEALFATALGLLAAIPSVIAYNRFIAEAGRYGGRLDAFADEFSAFLSRQLDEKRAR
jgi:biopolymer transport protein TolQ